MVGLALRQGGVGSKQLLWAFPKGSAKISLLSGLLMISSGQTGAEDCLRSSLCVTASHCCLKGVCLCDYEKAALLQGMRNVFDLSFKES